MTSLAALNAYCVLDLLAVPHALAAIFLDVLRDGSAWPTLNVHIMQADRRARLVSTARCDSEAGDTRCGSALGQSGNREC